MPIPLKELSPAYFDTVHEYGLTLPDGKTIWPPERFYKNDFQTVDDRATVLGSILAAIANMNLPVNSTLAQYQWAVRERQVITIDRVISEHKHDLDDPSLVETPDLDGDEDPEDDHGW